MPVLSTAPGSGLFSPAASRTAASWCCEPATFSRTTFRVLHFLLLLSRSILYRACFFLFRPMFVLRLHEHVGLCLFLGHSLVRCSGPTAALVVVIGSRTRRVIVLWCGPCGVGPCNVKQSNDQRREVIVWKMKTFGEWGRTRGNSASGLRGTDVCSSVYLLQQTVRPCSLYRFIRPLRRRLSALFLLSFANRGVSTARCFRWSFFARVCVFLVRGKLS